jgi:hypothetical protein
VVELGFSQPLLSSSLEVERASIDRSVWAASSVGRAPRSQRGGREFEPPAVHQNSQQMRSRGGLFLLYRGLWTFCGQVERLERGDPTFERRIRVPREHAHRPVTGDRHHRESSRPCSIMRDSAVRRSVLDRDVAGRDFCACERSLEHLADRGVRPFGFGVREDPRVRTSAPRTSCTIVPTIAAFVWTSNEDRDRVRPTLRTRTRSEPGQASRWLWRVPPRLRLAGDSPAPVSLQMAINSCRLRRS